MKNEIKLFLAKGNPTDLVMLDLSVAFDTIDHTTLLDCLSKWFSFSGSLCAGSNHTSVIVFKEF
jgi:hypothetical protein